MKKLLLAAAAALLFLTPAEAQPNEAPVGQIVYEYNTYAHIAANGTTTLRSQQGLLSGICINTKGASSNTITVYDNTAGSGTVIAVIDTTSAVGCLGFDTVFLTGLTVVVASGTAADITVLYR